MESFCSIFRGGGALQWSGLLQIAISLSTPLNVPIIYLSKSIHHSMILQQKLESTNIRYNPSISLTSNYLHHHQQSKQTHQFSSSYKFPFLGVWFHSSLVGRLEQRSQILLCVLLHQGILLITLFAITPPDWVIKPKHTIFVMLLVPVISIISCWVIQLLTCGKMRGRLYEAAPSHKHQIEQCSIVPIYSLQPTQGYNFYEMLVNENTKQHQKGSSSPSGFRFWI